MAAPRLASASELKIPTMLSMVKSSSDGEFPCARRATIELTIWSATLVNQKVTRLYPNLIFYCR
jgi:hypothetical protein